MFDPDLLARRCGLIAGPPAVAGNEGRGLGEGRSMIPLILANAAPDLEAVAKAWTMADFPICERKRFTQYDLN